MTEARSVAERVAGEAARSNLPRARNNNNIYAELAAIYSIQGEQLVATEAQRAAFVFATNATDRLQALGDVGIDLILIGAYDQTRVALEFVLRSKTDLRIRLNAAIELMDLESRVRDRRAFEHRRAAVDRYGPRMLPSMAVDYRFKVGAGLARFGERTRAEESLMSGLVLARHHSLGYWRRRIGDALNAGCSRAAFQP